MIYKTIPLFLCAVVFFSSCKKDETAQKIIDPNDTIPSDLVADSLLINQIQVIGSHNSYRTKTDELIFDFVQNLGSLLPANLDPDGWDYTHVPLPEQFSDYGIRQIELDIYHDPAGGRFYNRMGNQLVNEPTESGIADLNLPGLKVMHITDLDYNTNYITFKQALQAVKDWSDGHPSHLPIFILIETKETSLVGVVPFFTWTETLPFDVAAMNALDEEIMDVFGEDLHNLITPDVVRGSFATLEEAVTTRGWTSVGDSRGKVVFLLDNGGDAADFYLQGHPSLQGRILFVSGERGDAHAAFVKRNNPFETDIEQLVADGYLIRTRSDSETDEARTGDVTKRDRAFASGAQLISTDYYRADPRSDTSSEWSNYSVRLPNNEVARLNPVNGPESFIGGPIE
ncbi:MAG: phosphatidylinositol-specific phospholipase C1-like protein [Chitinophagales bacterium]|nr:phosphatidylinositol-specific phospholipase C1-like protein [Chitinophagales bacterium]